MIEKRPPPPPHANAPNPLPRTRALYSEYRVNTKLELLACLTRLSYIGTPEARGSSRKLK